MRRHQGTQGYLMPNLKHEVHTGSELHHRHEAASGNSGLQLNPYPIFDQCFSLPPLAFPLHKIEGTYVILTTSKYLHVELQMASTKE